MQWYQKGEDCITLSRERHMHLDQRDIENLAHYIKATTGKDCSEITCSNSHLTLRVLIAQNAYFMCYKIDDHHRYWWYAEYMNRQTEDAGPFDEPVDVCRAAGQHLRDMSYAFNSVREHQLAMEGNLEEE